jgi:DNA-binding NarL/FixJ family response regulator
MGERVPVSLYANDPVSYTGIASQLRSRSELMVIEDGAIESAQVGVVVIDEVDEETIKLVRSARRGGCSRVLLVVTRLDDRGLLAAIEAGASGFLRRATASAESLASGIKAVLVGDGTVPPDLLGRLLSQVSLIQQNVLTPRGLTFSGLSNRETEVLRLLADGHDTAAVARQLAYSERTVKNVLQDVTRRHCLRNRTHAVAYALRQGLI